MKLSLSIQFLTSTETHRQAIGAGKGESPGAGWQSLWGEGNSHGDLQIFIFIFFARKKLINHKKLAFFIYFIYVNKRFQLQFRNGTGIRNSIGFQPGAVVRVGARSGLDGPLWLFGLSCCSAVSVCRLSCYVAVSPGELRG